MPLYPKNKSKSLSRSLFEHPTAEYRGTPLWSWNNKLDRGQLLQQIDQLGAMGFGGGHIHCRTGLATPYMGKEFMEHVQACVEHAKAKGMLMWLYDEDRWPSGYGGGLVTQEIGFRARHLLFTPRPYGAGKTVHDRSTAGGSRTESGTLLWRYLVELNSDGTLKQYRLMGTEEKPRRGDKGTIWYAYLEVADSSSWYNHQAYADTLNPAAIEKFVEVTHDVYRNAVGKEFGKSVPAIFTDEPQFTRKTALRNAGDLSDLFWPFTDDLPETYFAAYGARIEEAFPEVIWDLPGNRPSVARYRYHDHVAERFAHAFADTVGGWCRSNGLLLTGHMMEEQTLDSQTSALGEAMRSYRGFDIPGIDMLCDRRELMTAKQAQSAAHQFGKPGQMPVMSELYGVTGWHFDFAGHKGQGDWQAALGVTVRVPHLAWVSMAGESKRDFPAAIGYQSPWYKRYPVVEDHFARLNTVLTRGEPLVKIAVVHPIESFWLCYGPETETRNRRMQAEAQFAQLTDWLLFDGLDFDFVCESLLPAQCLKQTGKRFRVGQMRYDVVIVPGMRTIRATTLDRLEALAAAGGQVLFAGQVPELVDAVPSARAQKLAAKSPQIPFERVAILESLEPFRELKIIPGVGHVYGESAPVADPFLHQFRTDGKRRYLFVCNTDRERGRQQTRLRIRGQWKLTQVDTVQNAWMPVAARYTNGWTELGWDAPAHGSLLLQLEAGRREGGASLVEGEWAEAGRLDDPVAVTLSERNVLLLDLAEWRTISLDDSASAWQRREEILRIDVLARERLNIPKRGGNMAQPWSDRRPDEVLGTLELRFGVTSEVAVAGVRLALEEAEEIEVFWDGQAVEKRISGYFVDEAIPTLAMPDVTAAVHELVLRIPMKRTRNVERCYLLGDFGVRVSGRHADLTEPVRKLTWGDWTRQGLPFYAGNVTYHCQIDTRGTVPGELVVETRFSNPLVDVAIDGGAAEAVAFAPFRAILPAERGKHSIDIMAYGNRANAFGAVHNCDRHLVWHGPKSYRSAGSQWSQEYQLRPMGVLTALLVRRQTGEPAELWTSYDP